MMKTKLSLAILAIFTLLMGCSKDENNCVSTPIASSGNCIDSTLIDPNMMCTDQWEPVCGCNGVTYSNSCYATNAGVTTYVDGECCD